MKETRKLVSNSIIMIIGTVLGGFFSYFFNMMVGRKLGPASYGDYAAIVSFMGILAVGGGAVTTVVMRYVGELSAEEDYRSVLKLFRTFSRYILFFSLIVFILSLFLIKPIAHFFTIDELWPFVIALVGFVFSFLFVVNKGTLQGLQNFVSVSVLGALEMFLRCVIGLGLIFIGMKLTGAILGMVLGSMVAYTVSFLPIRKIFRKSRSSIASKFIFDRKEILGYSVPTFFSSFMLLVFLNMDIIVVKHYFDPKTAGLYAALSTIGKIIVYATGPLALVMFPMISEKRIKGEKHYKVFWLSLVLTLLAGLCIQIIYFLAPGKVITILYGNRFGEIYYLLPQVGFMILLYSLTNTLANYYLSIKSFVYLYVMGGVLLVQLAAVMAWHGSLEIVVKILAGSQGLLFVLMIGYYLFTKRDQLVSYIKGSYE